MTTYRDKLNGVLYDEKQFDPDYGYLTQEMVQVDLDYKIVEEGEGHWDTIAEYDNGGKDIEWVWDTDPYGEWVAYESGTDTEIPDFDGDIPDGLNTDEVHTFPWFYRVYHAYTDDQLAANASEKAAEEVRRGKQQQVTNYLQTAEERADETDAAICSLYEMMLGE